MENIIQPCLVFVLFPRHPFLPIDLVTEVNESLASPYGAALLFTYFGPLDSRNGYVCKWAGKNLMNLMKQLLMICPTIMHHSMCQAETGL